jgi:Ala-tRNA(Pro) deacylase
MESPSPEIQLIEFLNKLDIAHETYRHPPVFTVEEAQQHRAHMPVGGHSKNLFIRDKKKQYALIIAEENQPINLKKLAETIGLGRVSFAHSERLQAYLGVSPGSVTPFALLNAFTQPAPDQPPIKVVLDAALMRQPLVYFHPLHNAATTAIKPIDLERFISACGFKPTQYTL